MKNRLKIGQELVTKRTFHSEPVSVIELYEPFRKTAVVHNSMPKATIPKGTPLIVERVLFGKYAKVQNPVTGDIYVVLIDLLLAAAKPLLIELLKKWLQPIFDNVKKRLGLPS